MATTAKRVKDARKPKFSSRKHNRCKLCGRPRGFLRKFGICRLCFRGLALQGRDSRRREVELVEKTCPTSGQCAARTVETGTRAAELVSADQARELVH